MQWFSLLPPCAQALFASLFTYGMTALGAATIFFSRRLNPVCVSFMTGAAAGIMIAASFFSLLLPALDYASALPSFFVVTAGFLAGGLFIVLSDCLLSKIKLKSSRRRSALLYGAVTLHNIPEGMAVGVAFASAGGYAGAVSAVLFAVGIGVQNFPEGVCVAYSLKGEGVSAGKSFFLSQLSGFAEVFSAVAGAFLLSLAESVMPWILSFSAGAMIAVVCSELIPEAFGARKAAASFGVVAGFAAMMLLDLAL